MLTQFLIPLLNKADDARVLFISAEQGREAKAYWGAYGVSKHAIEGFSKTLSEELEKTNIKVKDRKSTRLNSSHKPISYAVFCLKKKK